MGIQRIFKVTAVAGASGLIFTYLDGLGPSAVRLVEWDLAWTDARPPDTNQGEAKPIDDGEPEEEQAGPLAIIFLDLAAECMPERDCARNASGSSSF